MASRFGRNRQASRLPWSTGYNGQSTGRTPSRLLHPEKPFIPDFHQTLIQRQFWVNLRKVNTDDASHALDFKNSPAKYWLFILDIGGQQLQCYSINLWGSTSSRRTLRFSSEGGRDSTALETSISNPVLSTIFSTLIPG